MLRQMCCRTDVFIYDRLWLVYKLFWTDVKFFDDSNVGVTEEKWNK